MNAPINSRRMRRPLSRLLPWAVAVATLGASALGHAANGEADVFDARLSDQPAVTAMAAPQAVMVQPGVEATMPSAVSTAGTGSHVSVAQHAGPRSRAEVRESLSTANAAGLMLRNGEIAEPQPLLQAREDFIAMQTEQLQNEYIARVEANERVAQAEQERLAAEALARAETERISQLVDEATDRIAIKPEEVEIWVEPGTTVQELVSYIEQTGSPDAVAVLLVEQPADETD